MIWIYNLFVTFGSLFWVPWMLWRANRRKEAVDWKERTGDYRFQLKKGKPRLWLHAVSVGEVLAAIPILKEVRLLDPDLEIVLSVTTSSGHQTAREQPEGLFDHLVYYPIDVYRFVLAGLVRVRPSVVAVMETELWLNFLDASKNVRAQTVLVNGRISDRSFPRARALRFFYKDLLKRVDRCLMQSPRDADRIKVLGGRNVEVVGNCKFDQALEGLDADPVAWRKELGIDPARPVVVIGSTRGELEERLVCDGIDSTDAQYIWAPRHLERADALEAELRARSFRVVRRSRGDRLEPTGTVKEVLLLDTYGELAQVYCVADVVVIGGGFDRLGGQNLMQALAHGKPVVHGPHMQNFRDATEMAHSSGAAFTASTSQELRATLDSLLSNAELRRVAGEAASAMVKASQGSSRKYAQAIVSAARVS